MPWCPKCKTEYSDGVTTCVDCKEALINSQGNTGNELDTYELAQLEEKTTAIRLVKYLNYSGIQSANIKADSDSKCYRILIDLSDKNSAMKYYNAFLDVEEELSHSAATETDSTANNDAVELPTKEAFHTSDEDPSDYSVYTRKNRKSSEIDDDIQEDYPSTNCEDGEDTEADLDDEQDEFEENEADLDDEQDEFEEDEADLDDEQDEFEEDEANLDDEQDEFEEAQADPDDEQNEFEEAQADFHDEREDIEDNFNELEDFSQDKPEDNENNFEDNHELEMTSSAGSSYVLKKDAYKEHRSSASMFFVFSIGGLIFLGLNITGILQLINGLFSYFVMGAMFIAFFVLGIYSLRKAKEISTGMDAENELTEKINAYLEGLGDISTIDEADWSGLNDELLYFKRTTKLKQMVLQKFGAQNEAYLDVIIEEFYNANV